MSRREVISRTLYAMAMMAFIAVGFIMLRYCSLPEYLRNINRVFIKGMESGEIRKIRWNNKPFYVIRLNREMASTLNSLNDSVWRASGKVFREDEILIYENISTYLGCSLNHADKSSEFAHYYGKDWPGGYYDPCHIGAYDYAGRALKPILDHKKKPLRDLGIPKYEINVEEEYVLFKRDA